ncbi:unnamed protein product, partial [Caretta caretta]
IRGLTIAKKIALDHL